MTTLKDLAKTYREDEARLTRQIEALRERSKALTGTKKHTANRNLCCTKCEEMSETPPKFLKIIIQTSRKTAFITKKHYKISDLIIYCLLIIN